MSKITKATLAQSILDEIPKLKMKRSTEIVKQMFHFIGDEIALGKRFPIVGIGRLVATRKNERPGRNPKTGDPHTIIPKVAITLSKSEKKDTQRLSRRSDFLSNLSSNFDLTLKQCKFLHKLLIDTIISVGKGDSSMEIRGFGIFSPKFRKARTARNPKSGALVQVESKFVIHFKASKHIKTKAMNSGLFGTF